MMSQDCGHAAHLLNSRVVLRQKLTASILTCAFVAASVGFPLPALPIRGDAEFPCRDHGCGCYSAEMCRTNCCCYPAISRPEKPSCCSQNEPAACAENESDADAGLIVVIGALKCRGEAGKWRSQIIVRAMTMPRTC